MNNLIKAEWFRIRRSGGTFITAVIFSLTAVLISFSGSEIEFSLAAFVSHASIGMTFGIMGTVLAVSETYKYRLAYYEIMNGASAHAMIMSKLLLCVLMVTGLYFLPVCIILLIFDYEAFSVQTIFLLFLCLMKLTVFFMTSCIIVKNGIGVMASYFLFSLEALLVIFLQNIIETNLSPVMQWLTSLQITLVGINEVSVELLDPPIIVSSLPEKIIISFVLETGVMYFLSYLSIKKKWAINLKVQ